MTDCHDEERTDERPELHALIGAAVVSGGELMPQKSTHFYPKLLDGLVFHRY